MSVKIMSCTCKHDFQDKEYGKQQRVHNYAEKKLAFRCTVCKNEKLIRGEVKK